MNIMSTLELKQLLGYSPTTWLHDVIWKDKDDYYYPPGFIAPYVPQSIRIKKIARNQWAFVYKPTAPPNLNKTSVKGTQWKSQHSSRRGK